MVVTRLRNTLAEREGKRFSFDDHARTVLQTLQTQRESLVADRLKTAAALGEAEQPLAGLQALSAGMTPQTQAAPMPPFFAQLVATGDVHGTRGQLSAAFHATQSAEHATFFADTL